MLKKLTYIVDIASTGQKFNQNLSFEPGLTVITGENEAGKSLIIEMIRYALFGSVALRGPRSGYNNLKVTLVLDVKGKSYTIIRDNSKSSVNTNEAVGTSATNKYMEQVLGFDISVFDICLAALQGKLDQLTNIMKPTERRTMVDRVTGLNQFEEVGKYCSAQSNEARLIAKALSDQILPVVKPNIPDGFEEPRILQDKVNEGIRNKAIKDSFVYRDEPIMPETPSVSLQTFKLDLEYNKDKAIRESIQSQLDRCPTSQSNYTEAELDLLSEALAQQERGPRPQGYSLEELNKFSQDHYELANSDIIICDECGHFVKGKPLPEIPPLTPEQIEAERSAISKWEGYNFNPKLPTPSLTKESIEYHRQVLSSQSKRTNLLKQLSDLGDQPPDVSQDKAVLDEYYKQIAVYENQMVDYDVYLDKLSEVEALPEMVEGLSDRLEASRSYLSDKDKYDSISQINSDLEDKISNIEATRQEWKKGSDALKSVRSEVKQYIIPAICKISSNLLSEMTAGERNEIKITEDFEIYVDNQHVMTLSGSGIYVANLAVRIALGRVLTHNVLPIFLADEIDANMAEKRTKATHDSLMKLKPHLDQIIVITHKNFEGDHSICLSN